MKADLQYLCSPLEMRINLCYCPFQKAMIPCSVVEDGFYCRIHEDMTLRTVIEKHLKPGPWNHQLKHFCDEQLDNLRFFIRKYPKVIFPSSSVLMKFSLSVCLFMLWIFLYNGGGVSDQLWMSIFGVDHPSLMLPIRLLSS